MNIFYILILFIVIYYLHNSNLQKQKIERIKQKKEVQLKKIIKLLYDNNNEKADALIANWNEKNPDYKFTDNHTNRRFEKYSEKMKLKEEKAKEIQRKKEERAKKKQRRADEIQRKKEERAKKKQIRADEAAAKRKVHKAKLLKAKKARKEKIYNFLKLKGGKIPASDIDFHLKFKNIDRTKNECEEMYRIGKIGRTGNYRFFV